MEAEFRRLWTENGDYLSLLYAGSRYCTVYTTLPAVTVLLFYVYVCVCVCVTVTLLFNYLLCEYTIIPLYLTILYCITEQ